MKPSKLPNQKEVFMPTERHVSVVYDVTVPVELFKNELEPTTIESLSDESIVEKGLDSIYKKFVNDETLPNGLIGTIYDNTRFEDGQGFFDENEITVVFSFDPTLTAETGE